MVRSLRFDWELNYHTRLVKMADKLKRKGNQMIQEQMMKFSLTVILAAALSARFQMTRFEILNLLAVVWVSLQLLQIAKMMISTELFVRKLVGSSDRMKFARQVAAGSLASSKM